VKKYIKADYTMPAAVNIISTEIQDNSKALRDMSSSSNQNSGLLMLMGYGSDNDGDDDGGKRESMLKPVNVVREEIKMASRALPVTYRFIHDLVYGEYSAKIDSTKYNVTPEVLELLIMSSLLSAYVPNFKSRFAYMFQRYLNSCVKASAATKRLTDVLPGCYSTASVTAYETKELKELMSSGLSVNLNKYIYLAVYDNIQIKASKKTEGGNVETISKMDTSSSASGGGILKKEKKKLVDVRTCCQFNIFKNVEHLATLQTDPLSTPIAMYKKFPIENVPENAMAIHETIITFDSEDLADPNPLNLSDKQYIDYEFQYQATLAIEEVIRSNSWKSQSRGENLLQEMKVAIDPQSKQKYCIDGCLRANLNRAGKCTFCLKKLKSMPEILQSRKRQKLEHTSVTNPRIGGKDENNLTVMETYTPVSTAEKKESNVYFQNLVPTTYPFETLNINMVDENVIEYQVDNSVERLVLPLLDVNPGEHRSISLIQSRFLEMLGYKQEGGVFSMFICSDAGAINLSEYLKDEIELFHILIGLGHTEMAVTRLCMKVIIAAFGDDFVKAHSFKSEKAIEYLLSCKPNHKSFTFIQLCNAVLHVELVNQFFLLEYEKGSGGKDYSTIDAGTSDQIFKEYLDNYINNSALNDDFHLQNAIFVCQILSNSLLLRKAMRANNGKGDTFAIDAAIKLFLPLFYKFGFTTYAPLLHKQYVDLRYRSSPKLREAKRLLSIVEGQGPDFGMEQTIQSALRNRKGREGKHLQRSLLNLNSQFIFKNKFTNMVSNKKLKVTKRRLRTLKERDEDFSQFSLVFRLHNTLKYQKGRKRITSFDNKNNWISGVKLMDVWHEGYTLMRQNQRKDEQHPNPFQDTVSLSIKLLEGADIVEPGTTAPLDNFNLDKENEAVRILRKKLRQKKSRETIVVAGTRRAPVLSEGYGNLNVADSAHEEDDLGEDDGSEDDDSEEESSDDDDDDDDDDT